MKNGKKKRGKKQRKQNCYFKIKKIIRNVENFKLFSALFVIQTEINIYFKYIFTVLVIRRKITAIIP